MELELNRDPICSYETLAEVTLCQEETLEAIVPDACPDIERMVDVCGQATLSSKQAGSGVASVSGMVRVSVIYRPEGENGLQRVELGLPFTCQVDAPGLTEQGKVLAEPRLRFAEARALNPRKVLLRVDLAVDVTACQPVQHMVCQGIDEEDEAGICQRQFHGESYELSAVQEKPFTLSEQIRLQGTQGDAPRLLGVQAQPLCTESKLIGSKLIFKGVVDLALLLQESGGEITSVRESLPFSQVVEVTQSGEEGDCQVQVEMTDLRCEMETGNGRNVDVVLELLVQAQVRCRRPVTFLQDVYSTVYEMEVESRPHCLYQFGEQSIRTQTVRELLETGETVRGVTASRLNLGQVTQVREGGQTVLTAEAWLTILYLDEDDQVRCLQKMIPVSCRIDCPADQTCTCRCSCTGEVFAAPAAGGVEVRFSIDFHSRTTGSVNVVVVEQARIGERRISPDGTKPSVVLRLPVPGEGLWEIAKAYGTTIQQIVQANGLEGEEIPSGKMLLIPAVR